MILPWFIMPLLAIAQHQLDWKVRNLEVNMSPWLPGLFNSVNRSHQFLKHCNGLYFKFWQVVVPFQLPSFHWMPNNTWDFHSEGLPFSVLIGQGCHHQWEPIFWCYYPNHSLQVLANLGGAPVHSQHRHHLHAWTWQPVTSNFANQKLTARNNQHHWTCDDNLSHKKIFPQSLPETTNSDIGPKKFTPFTVALLRWPLYLQKKPH